MKDSRKKPKIFSFRVYGILDKNKKEITKISLNEEEIQLEVDLENLHGNLALCSFDVKVKIPI